MDRRLCALVLASSVAACTPQPAMPSNASTIGDAPDRPIAVPMSASGAAPQIVHIRYDDVAERGPGGRFRGRIWTSSNVASVEVRTNLFSINAAREGVGHFAFDVEVYDLPPIFVRPYALRVIARNTAGAEAEEDLPFRIR